MKSIFIIDNYDSFTFNLVHLIEQLDLPHTVKRNDEFELQEIAPFSHILISPGPGIPAEAGKTIQAVQRFAESKSILGVCLGMQALLEHFGAKMINMPTVQHGAQSIISISEKSKLLSQQENTMKVGRYHSWAFTEDEVPEQFKVTASSEDNYVMAIEHQVLPLFGVQFHPESIMTENGLEILKNWLKT